MRPSLNLARTVSRGGTACAHCPWITAPLDPEYAITVGGVPLVRYCSAAHAETDARLRKRGPLTVVYAAVAQ